LFLLAPFEWGSLLRTGMQSLLPWFAPVACCMAIQGFWLGLLLVLHPQHKPEDLQDLHRFSRNLAPNVQSSGLTPRA
jgi:hypothetical protein